MDELIPDIIGGTLIHRILIRRQVPTKTELARIIDGFIMPAISLRQIDPALVATNRAQ